MSAVALVLALLALVLTVVDHLQARRAIRLWRQAAEGWERQAARWQRVARGADRD